MSYRKLSLKLPTDFTPEQLRAAIARELHLKEFTYHIETQSLDARKKADIHWLVNVSVTSGELTGTEQPFVPTLQIPYQKRREKAVVVGSGPAGFFSALMLQKAGSSVTLIERGKEVDQRAASIQSFEHGGAFDPSANYAFGEGGAGTFSDGKLTSRSKHISQEKQFILSQYILAGAPPEIEYLAHPHLGSDNLRGIVKKLREMFQSLGGIILFETMLDDLVVKDGQVTSAVTSAGTLDADVFILAPGHSAYETYRMLIRHGVQFRNKNFAIGSRVEHPQVLINRAQWGKEILSGVKAAEYRLTANIDGALPVYTFCMCPGGTVVPSTAYSQMSNVNGMSAYARNGAFANAGCVAAVNLNELLDEEVAPLKALAWVENLEQRFYQYKNGYQIPACTIMDFIRQTETSDLPATSYPLGLIRAPLWELLPAPVSESLRAGLIEFRRKVQGFETGVIMGLESKTSSPIQAVRDDHLRCAGFSNLYLAGEGSGHSGGIISSAADGVKIAMGVLL